MERNFYTQNEVIQANITGGIGKIKTPWYRLFFLGMMAGAFIAFGAETSNVVMHTIEPVGLARLAAGCVFPVGLMMIVFAGGELFTGDCLLFLGIFDKKVTTGQMARTLLWVFLGNLAGGVCLAAMVFGAKQFDYSGGALGAFTIKVALGKVQLAPVQAVISGILCNIMVCVAVLMAGASTDITGKVCAIFFPIMAFVVSGFEHCVANMYYIPAGLLSASNPEYVRQAQELYQITAQQLQQLTAANFLIRNLLPVTVGNILGALIVSLFKRTRQK